MKTSTWFRLGWAVFVLSAFVVLPEDGYAFLGAGLIYMAGSFDVLERWGRHKEKLKRQARDVREECPYGFGLCQCVNCHPVGFCVELDTVCLDCDGPVDGCEPPEDGENDPA